MKVCLVVGTQPNFVKAAPIIRAFRKYEIDFELVYTGQHYDKNMSKDFIQDSFPIPDHHFMPWDPENNPASEKIQFTMAKRQNG